MPSMCQASICIRVCNLADDFYFPENFVIIKKDEISIAAPMEYTVHINDTGELKATTEDKSGTDLLLNDLKNRLITRGRKQVNREI